MAGATIPPTAPAEARQLELPLGLVASSSVSARRRADGVIELRARAPQLEGTVRDAREALGGVSTTVIYELLATGQIRGYKANPGARKSRWRILMGSVWALKERQLRG
jgi:hypothetical protein